MSQKDEAVGKVIRLLEQCQAATVLRIADDLEQSLEIGPYGVVYSREPDECSSPDSSTSQRIYETSGSGV
ncbi:MAG: hypothetical protein Q7R41_16115 [Phycisphaerales bacterium]|nr:hypothetical protein [Phycisphaerales bacterium]